MNYDIINNNNIKRQNRKILQNSDPKLINII